MQAKRFSVKEKKGIQRGGEKRQRNTNKAGYTA